MMKIKKCTICDNEIPTGRVKALPNVTTCVKCSDENRYYANQIISDDENYTEIEFIKDKNTISQIQRYKNSLGKGLPTAAQDTPDGIQKDDE